MASFQRLAACALFAGLIAGSAAAEPVAAPSYGQQLEGFAFPFPLHRFAFESQGERLSMAFLDVAPTGPAKNRVVVLMHGKNFCAATWENQIAALAAAGYRVIAPDQIGFCASTKPAHYQYSFQQLATNTRELLKSLGVEKAAIVGHSTGGMLATRYALMFPEAVSSLTLANPIGLEDWKAKGVPYRSIDRWLARELQLDGEKIRAYEQKTYYVGRWKPEYQKWVDMLAGLNRGPGHEIVALNSALIYDMIYTQPVVYEFGDLKIPTTLLIGTADITAIGADAAPPEVRKNLGHYDVLGKQTAAKIPGAELIEFDGLGHAPQMEEPERFNAALLQAVAR